MAQAVAGIPQQSSGAQAPDLVGATEVGRRLGRSAWVVVNLKRTCSLPWPEPALMTARGPLWHWRDVVTWLQLARPDLAERAQAWHQPGQA